MNHKDLDVWKTSMDLACAIYQLTSDLPSEEKFGLISQMRRSAVSVPSNIAEGCGRSSDKQLSQFLSISTGSLAELETQLILCERLKMLISVDKEMEMLVKVRKLLGGLERYLKSK